jgi:hypothetical protein
MPVRKKATSNTIFAWNNPFTYSAYKTGWLIFIT